MLSQDYYCFLTFFYLLAIVPSFYSFLFAKTCVNNALSVKLQFILQKHEELGKYGPVGAKWVDTPAVNVTFCYTPLLLLCSPSCLLGEKYWKNVNKL